MDTWTDKKFSSGKFSTKSEKSKHAHMKQIILPSTILDFTWLVIDGFIEVLTERPKEIWNFTST